MLKWIFFVSALLFASSINAQESFRQIQKPVICGTQPDIFEKIQEAGEDDIQRRNTIAILLQEWNLSAKYNIGKKVTKEGR